MSLVCQVLACFGFRSIQISLSPKCAPKLPSLGICCPETIQRPLGPVLCNLSFNPHTKAVNSFVLTGTGENCPPSLCLPSLCSTHWIPSLQHLQSKLHRNIPVCPAAPTEFVGLWKEAQYLKFLVSNYCISSNLESPTATA